MYFSLGFSLYEVAGDNVITIGWTHWVSLLLPGLFLRRLPVLAKSLRRLAVFFGAEGLFWALEVLERWRGLLVQAAAQRAQVHMKDRCVAVLSRWHGWAGLGQSFSGWVCVAREDRLRAEVEAQKAEVVQKLQLIRPCGTLEPSYEELLNQTQFEVRVILQQHNPKALEQNPLYHLFMSDCRWLLAKLLPTKNIPVLTMAAEAAGTEEALTA